MSASTKEIAELKGRIAALERLVLCPRCKGSGGMETARGPITCLSCEGTTINPAICNATGATP